MLFFLIVSTISAIGKFTFEIGNSRDVEIVENVCPEKMSNHLLKFNHVTKLDKK